MAAAVRRGPLAAALLTVALHLPFLLRYDLHFQPDGALSMLIARAITAGERPVMWWGHAYPGCAGQYLTAALFEAFGESVPLAGAVSLAVWASGVGLATALAGRLLGTRAAGWTGLAAAIGSPYATHYATQPFSSYETAPVLAVLVLAAAAWSEGLAARPVGTRVIAQSIGLGLLLGVGWWTTRLFLPAVAAVVLAHVLCARWPAAVRSPVVVALVGSAFVVGASPDLLHRLGYFQEPSLDPAASSLHELALAPASMMPLNLLQALRALPAFLNGDPRARLPEGVTFIRALANGEEPYAGAGFSPGPVATLLDGLVVVLVAGILVAAVVTAARAWRDRRPALLALCLTPFVHPAFIALSGRTNGGYYEARRYWFASLLVVPVLLGNAVAHAETVPVAPLRAGARGLVAVVLAWSVVAQARLLALPDELADHRVLVHALLAEDVHDVVMPGGDGWLVSGLAGGRLRVGGMDTMRPELLTQVVAADRIAVVLPASLPIPPERVTIRDRSFVRDGEPRRAAAWQWIVYAADRAAAAGRALRLARGLR